MAERYAQYLNTDLGFDEPYYYSCPSGRPVFDGYKVDMNYSKLYGFPYKIGNTEILEKSDVMKNYKRVSETQI